MLKINKKVEYALMTLKFLGQKPPGELTSAREIGDAFGVPFDTVAKVMQSLRKNHILESVKGLGGGHRLCKDLSQLSYLQLVEIVEERPLEGPCQSEKGPCAHLAHCNITTPIDRLNQKVMHYLRSLTISDLLQSDIPLTSGKHITTIQSGDYTHGR